MESVDLYGQMWSIRKIAEHQGRGYKAVRGELLREGVQLRRSNTVGLHTHSPETRAKIAASMSGERNPNYGRTDLRPPSMLGRTHSAETRAKMSQTRRERGLSAGTRNPMADPEAVRRWSRACNLKPNRKEIILHEMLEAACPGEYMCNVEADVVVGSKIPDFVSVNAPRLVEMFGDYWHRDEDPQDRIDFFAQYGFQTLVIWESELATPEPVLQKIFDFSR